MILKGDQAWWQTPLQLADGLATIAIAFATLVYAWFACRQWLAIRDQAEYTRRTAEAASNNAIAARDNAIAASKSAENFVNVERPWIGISARGFAQNRGLTAGNVPVNILDFTNYGRTPAFIVGFDIKGTITPALPPDPVYPVIPTHLPHLPGSGMIVRLGEPQTTQYFWTAAITQNDVNEIQAGHTYLWVYGRITYRDFLQKPHTTGFCFKWDPHAQLRLPLFPPGTFPQGAFLVDGPEQYIYYT